MNIVNRHQTQHFLSRPWGNLVPEVAAVGPFPNFIHPGNSSGGTYMYGSFGRIIGGQLLVRCWKRPKPQRIHRSGVIYGHLWAHISFSHVYSWINFGPVIVYEFVTMPWTTAREAPPPQRSGTNLAGTPPGKPGKWVWSLVIPWAGSPYQVLTMAHTHTQTHMCV